MADPYDQGLGVGALGTHPDSYPIVPSDSDALTRPVRAVRSKTAGTIRCITFSGDERTIEILDGETRYVGIKKVFATGTTATGLEGMP